MHNKSAHLLHRLCHLLQEPASYRMTSRQTASAIMQRSVDLKLVFSQLVGTWRLDRRLSTSNAAEPSGKCTGEVLLKPRLCVGAQMTPEMLYYEMGGLELSTSPTVASSSQVFSFSRKYVWRLSLPADDGPGKVAELSIWFTKPDTEEPDYVFHNLEFSDNEAQVHSDGSITVVARGSHLCVEDMYDSEYSFFFQCGKGGTEGAGGLQLASWTTKHKVTGPRKDQVIETLLTIPS